MTAVVPKFYHVMDVHMKTWSGYGKTRLSNVSFSNDPLPKQISDVRVLTQYDVTDYVIVPDTYINTVQDIDDVWAFVTIE